MSSQGMFATRRLPAEWERQAAVQLTWPDLQMDWGPALAQVEPVFAQIATEILARQPLLIVVRDAAQRAAVAARLGRADKQAHSTAAHPLHFAAAAADDTWARDHGAITVLDDEGPTLLDFEFNGWGNKFPAHHDNAITARLVESGVFGTARHEPQSMVLEGGSIESDGNGVLLTTRHCLGTPTRNPDRSFEEIETELCRILGAERVLWLEHGALEGDDTDGHIDTLARFISTDTIAHVICNNPDDPHYHPLQAMREELQAFRTRDGRPYRLIELPLPAAIRDEFGQRLPATHANFLFVNDALLLPVYDDPTDAIAIERLRQALPERTIVPIDCRQIIRQGGSLHCLSMQFPAALAVTGTATF